MYQILQEEIARMQRRDIEARASFNAVDARTRALRPAAKAPGAMRRAVAKGLFRAGLTLMGENPVVTLAGFEREGSTGC